MAYGTCKKCGCTNEKACYHPDYGPCSWADPGTFELCSFCRDFPDDPAVLRPATFKTTKSIIMEKQDKFGYELIIKEALPDAMIQYVDNFDDVNFGWEICPRPGILIEVKVQMYKEIYVQIVKYRTVTHNGHRLERHEIYDGELPANDELEGPDLDFFKKLIHNWPKMGH